MELRVFSWKKDVRKGRKVWMQEDTWLDNGWMKDECKEEEHG